MSKRGNILFWCLYAIVWIIFLGVSIEAGGLVVNFFFSLYNPEILPKLYQKLDLTDLYNKNQMGFFGIYGLILSISILQAVMFYVVISMMHKMDLQKPFSGFVSKQIFKISYFSIAVGLLGSIAQKISKNLMHQSFKTENADQFWGDSGAFILMGAVVYIIADIFKKGVDLQHENDLTV